MIFNNTSTILPILIFLLLSCISCKGQVTQEGSSPVETSSTLEIGNISVLNQYRDGEKDGLWRTYYQTGQLKTEGRYSAGLKEGVHKEWAEDGILLLEGIYAQGKANGLMKWYHERGHLAGEGNMVDDIRFGPWKICDVEENGFCIEAHFKDGKRDGVWRINHEDANDKLWKEQTWKDDKVVSERCWDKNGIEIACD